MKEEELRQVGNLKVVRLGWTYWYTVAARVLFIMHDARVSAAATMLKAVLSI